MAEETMEFKDMHMLHGSLAGAGVVMLGSAIGLNAGVSLALGGAVGIGTYTLMTIEPEESNEPVARGSVDDEVRQSALLDQLKQTPVVAPTKPVPPAHIKPFNSTSGPPTKRMRFELGDSIGFTRTTSSLADLRRVPGSNASSRAKDALGELRGTVKVANKINNVIPVSKAANKVAKTAQKTVKTASGKWVTTTVNLHPIGTKTVNKAAKKARKSVFKKI